MAAMFRMYAKEIRKHLRSGRPDLAGLYNDYWEAVERWTELAKKHLKDCPAFTEMARPVPGNDWYESLTWLAAYCEHAAVVLEEAGRGSVNGSDIPTLTEDEEKVLKNLDDEYPRIRTQEQITAAVRITQKTVGRILKRLRDSGLACYPPDKKKGSVITSWGRDYVAKYLS